MLMSNEELIEQTGCATLAAQIHWMTSHGIKHVLDRYGNPKVAKAEFDRALKRRAYRTKPALVSMDRLKKRRGSVMLPRTLCGIYFLLKGDDVVYVGKTTNLFSRMGSTQIPTKILIECCLLRFRKRNLICTNVNTSQRCVRRTTINPLEPSAIDNASCGIELIQKQIEFRPRQHLCGNEIARKPAPILESLVDSGTSG